jgi:uncharacterized LabA/DUF88 family protein
MSPGTACIFIDGENLRHSLVDLFDGHFDPADYLPKNADWTGLFDWLTRNAKATSRLRTYWYTVEHIDFWPWGLNSASRDPVKLFKILSSDKQCGRTLSAIADAAQRQTAAQRKAADLLRAEGRMHKRFEGWKVFQDGISRRFESVEFRRSGSIHYNLFSQRLGKEKAVDVNLATDLLELRNIYDIAIVVSGDQDYVPAVQAVKNSGKQVVNVSFRKRDGMVLPGGARRLNQATDRTIEMTYNELFGFMRFPVPVVTPPVVAATVPRNN